MAGPARPSAAARALRLLPLAAVLLLAGFLRFQGLTPTSYYGDEAEYAGVARSLARDPGDLAYPPLGGWAPAPFVSQPPAVLYLFALGTLLWGDDGPALVSAGLGTATVALAYLLGRRVAGDAAGLLGALFLAILPSHVAVSRMALLDAGLAFFVTLALALFLEYLRRPGPWLAAATGAAVGLAALAKLPGLLAAVPIAVVLAWTALSHLGNLPRRATRKEAKGALGLALRDAGLMALPAAALALLWLGLLWSLRATTDLVAKLGWQAARVAGTAAVPAPVSRPWHWYFTDPDLGLPTQAGLAVGALAGLGWLLGCWRFVRERSGRPGRLVLLLWPLTFVAFFAASDRKEWFYLVPALPALAVLAGCGLHDACSRLLPARKGLGARQAAPWLAAALAALAALQPAAASMAGGIGEAGYGLGYPEAAGWIHARDPQAAQAGQTLGRFALHFYNGHPTYDAYTNRTFVEQEAEAGRLRFLVRDPYYATGEERAWLEGLAARHGGEVAHRVPNGHGRFVEVVELTRPGAGPAPTRAG
jgi:4-amino-4-deoxy-L-arabinose transferase-like glycosyltransferase